MTFDFTTEMILSHLLPSITINKKSDCKDHQIYSKILCKDHQIYSKILKEICKKSNLSFMRVTKNSSFGFDQHFVY